MDLGSAFKLFPKGRAHVDLRKAKLLKKYTGGCTKIRRVGHAVVKTFFATDESEREDVVIRATMEVRCLYLLRHTDLVPKLYEVYRRNGTVYIVTEYIPCDSGKSPVSDQVQLVSICNTLYSYGIIHGDLYARNMVVRRHDSRVMLVDFEHATVHNVDAFYDVRPRLDITSNFDLFTLISSILEHRAVSRADRKSEATVLLHTMALDISCKHIDFVLRLIDEPVLRDNYQCYL
jgi:serine/threonine protein kinase